MAKASLADYSREAHEERRPCRSCYGGCWVLLDADYDPETGLLTQVETPCPLCDGSGERSVYLYAEGRR
jgi:hypothetical protein